jgi:hypothetical protein
MELEENNNEYIPSFFGIANYIALLLGWAISAFASYVMAILSINQRMINIVLFADVVSLLAALFYASKQKTDVAFIAALAPLLAIFCFFTVASLISSL